MTLIVVENGTGLDNANSYISVAEADTYHTTYGNTTWTGSNALKEQYIFKAMQYLENTYFFHGYRTYVVQALQFPRTNIPVDYNEASLDGTVPQKLKDAICELALLSISNNLEPNITKNDYIKYVKVEDAVAVSYGDSFPVNTQFIKVDKLLSSLVAFKRSKSNKLARV